MNPVWTLQQHAGPPLRMGRQLESELSIGRALDNDLVLLDPAVSRVQARMQPDGEGMLLEALAVGTLINDAALEAGTSQKLEAGDWLGFGPWQFRLVRFSERIVPASLAPTLARDRLHRVHDFCRRAAASRDETALIGALLDSVLHGSGCERVLLITPRAPFAIEAALPDDAREQGFSHSLVAASVQGMVQLEHLDDQPSESMLALGITQALCLPLPGDEQGRVLYLDGRDRLTALPPQAAIFVQTLAESAGLALTRLARERAMARQSEELWRDLHDELGSFLLGKVYAAATPEAAGVAREALAEVRRLVNASRVIGGGSRSLFDALQTECEERCADAGCELVWDGDVAERPLDERGALDLLRLVREWVSNSLRHADAKRLDIRIEDAGDWLHMHFRHPLRGALELPAKPAPGGSINWPRSWSPGTGLRSIESRLQRLQGTAYCRQETDNSAPELHFECRIPWHRVST